MSSFICLSVRFLDSAFHGKSAGGRLEWPPSPLRFFQAIVAAAGFKWRDDAVFSAYPADALRWLERLKRCPVIVAPPAGNGNPYRLYVPNNAMDVVAGVWRRGNTQASIAEHRTEKRVQPQYLLQTDTRLPGVHYLWQIADEDRAECEKHKETLFAAARSIVALGWGVDMAVGHGQMLDESGVRELKGERWQPDSSGGGTRLRVPKPGTFDALVQRHQDFLERLPPSGGFKPVPPLTTFDTVGYRREKDLPERSWAAFSILDPQASRNRSFDTPRRCRDVAAWLRNATAQVCEGWPFGSIAGFVHGHTEDGHQLKGEKADERFMYLPLPSIERRGDRGEHVGAIRRVMVAAPPGFNDRVNWIRRRLPGQELTWNGESVGLLNLLPTSDWVLGRYTGQSRTWSTVTPVVWPGHDDRDRDKAERLLRKALVDAGLSRALVEEIVELDWRPVGFRAGVELAQRYAMPAQLKGPRYHVRVRFAHPIRGPLAVGAGRYRGLGLFAAEADASLRGEEDRGKV